MAQPRRVRDLMTPDPITMPADATVADAARAMRDRNIGDVVVVQEDTLVGVLTDRDIAVRVAAEGRPAEATTVGEICSRDAITVVAPSDRVTRAVTLMREKAVRRLPVVQDGRPVGIVSLGDLAVERDRRSVLGEISAAPPNL